MKTRLLIFVAALLLLPLCGLLVSGASLGDLRDLVMQRNGAAPTNPSAVLLTTLLVAGFIFLVNRIVGLLAGRRPFQAQRDFFLWIAAASIALGWLLVYLNFFAAGHNSQPGSLLLQLLLCTPLFALLAPAVLLIRALLGSFGGPLKLLSGFPPLPALRHETSIIILLPPAVLGLLGGAAWPDTLFWLYWLAPLLLLAALQLLWGEGTIFTALQSGNWARLVLSALSGMITGNFVVLSYLFLGGTLTVAPGSFFVQAGYAGFGLLCLQLGDVLAENWRGKQRPSRKKSFPIPVVSKPTSPE
jgi:hypothetical protein